MWCVMNLFEIDENAEIRRNIYKNGDRGAIFATQAFPERVAMEIEMRSCSPFCPATDFYFLPIWSESPCG